MIESIPFQHDRSAVLKFSKSVTWSDRVQCGGVKIAGPYLGGKEAVKHASLYL